MRACLWWFLGLASSPGGAIRWFLAGLPVDPTLPTTAIVTSGPYQYSRNPLYLGLTLIFVGLTLTMNTWWGIVA